MGMLVVSTPPSSEPLSVAEVMQYLRLDESNAEPAPTAPTIALASPAAPGNCTAGAHRVLVTFVTADGETQAGAVSAAATVANASVNGQIAVSAIPIGGALVTARKLYMTQAGGAVYLLAATIANNTATTATINVADAALGAQAPTTNTTADPQLSTLITVARQQAEAELHRYLITQTVDLYLDAFSCEEIILPPLQSVTSITYTDTDGATQTLGAGLYSVDEISEPARITPAYGEVWPVARYQENAVKVRFVAGYGTAANVPACVKAWMLLKLAELHPAVATPMPEYAAGIISAERIWRIA